MRVGVLVSGGAYAVDGERLGGADPGAGLEALLRFGQPMGLSIGAGYRISWHGDDAGSIGDAPEENDRAHLRVNTAFIAPRFAFGLWDDSRPVYIEGRLGWSRETSNYRLLFEDRTRFGPSEVVDIERRSEGLTAGIAGGTVVGLPGPFSLDLSVLYGHTWFGEATHTAANGLVATEEAGPGHWFGLRAGVGLYLR